MREKIALHFYHADYDTDIYWEELKEIYLWNADEVIRDLTVEIEKVENPYDSYYRMGRYDGFEDCRAGILLLLRPKEKVVRSELCP